MKGEIVQPGYHKVFFARSWHRRRVWTSTARVGFHRYTFPASEKSHIAFSLDQYLAHGKMQGPRASSRSATTEIEGYVVMAPTHRRKKAVHGFIFVASFSKPFDRLLAWEKKSHQAAFAGAGKETPAFSR